MAVVRAGDAQSLLDTDEAESSPGGRNTLRGESGQHVLSLDDNGAASERSGDRITPLQIPPPSAIPLDLVSSVQPMLLPAEAVAEAPAAQDATVTREGGSQVDVVTSVEAGSESVAPRVPARRPKYGSAAIVLTSLGLLGGLLAAVHAHSGHTGTSLSSTKAAPTTPKVPVVPSAGANDTAPEAKANTIAVGPAITSSAETTAADGALSATTRVTLELMPIDAKVSLRGHEVSGPPFQFDIKKGGRLAVEISRAGFVTARVVLDGKKPLVHFGMLREGQHPAKHR